MAAVPATHSPTLPNVVAGITQNQYSPDESIQ